MSSGFSTVEGAPDIPANRSALCAGYYGSRVWLVTAPANGTGNNSLHFARGKAGLVCPSGVGRARVLAPDYGGGVRLLSGCNEQASDSDSWVLWVERYWRLKAP